MRASESVRTSTHLGAWSGGAAAVAAARVPRPELVDRLLQADERVIAVVAPPGYGKSILLEEWAERRGSRVSWVSCADIGDDPTSLWTAVAAGFGSRAARLALRPAGFTSGAEVVRHLTRQLGGSSGR